MPAPGGYAAPSGPAFGTANGSAFGSGGGSAIGSGGGSAFGPTGGIGFGPDGRPQLSSARPGIAIWLVASLAGAAIGLALSSALLTLLR